MKKIITAILVALSFACGADARKLGLEDIHIRDPFILADKTSGTYYLYCSMSCGKLGGVGVYKSRDLRSWDGPERVFTVPEDNWINGTVWAPEVHLYKGRYYLFATLNTKTRWRDSRPDWADFTFRGTQVFVADSPEGPFEAISKCPQTPMNHMCLDGTLWVEKGVPYIVYCNEWVQSEYGRIAMCGLSPDLSMMKGTPEVLITACDAPWCRGRAASDGVPALYVTDGPWLYRTKTGKLLMLWSSGGDGGYTVGIAESDNGSISGNWTHQSEPLFTADGGHAMMFRDFSGSLRLVLHCPNNPGGKERARIFYVDDCGDTLKLK